MILGIEDTLYTVVDSTRDSIMYFIKDNTKDLPFGRGTVLLWAYSNEGEHFIPTYVLDTGE